MNWCFFLLQNNVANFSTDAAPTETKQWISEVMKSNENVSAYGRRSVETVYKALENNGFTHENCSKIITTHPQVLGLRKEQIEYRLQIWNMAKFSRTQYYE